MKSYRFRLISGAVFRAGGFELVIPGLIFELGFLDWSSGKGFVWVDLFSMVCVALDSVTLRLETDPLLLLFFKGGKFKHSNFRLILNNWVYCDQKLPR